MKRYINLSFLFLFVLTSAQAFAHQFAPTEATVKLSSEGKVVVNVDIDVIEMFQQVINLEGRESTFMAKPFTIDDFDQMLIEKVRGLPATDIAQALELVEKNILQRTFIDTGEEELYIEDVLLPSVNFVQSLLAQPPEYTDYRITTIMHRSLPQDIHSIRIQFPGELGSVKLGQPELPSMLVAAGSLSMLISLDRAEKPSAIAQISNYLYQGILHIIPKGLDHILFILALFLLSTQFKPLLWQVTVFTLAHTITLLLAGYQLVNVSGSIVEPLIALSIAFVALENMLHNQLKSWRILIIFAFGLLHGLGFASVLLDLGLPTQWAFISLISFNVGVEFGQLFVVAGAFLLVGWFRNKEWYRKVVVLPASGLIAATGLFWTIERLIV